MNHCSIERLTIFQPPKKNRMWYLRDYERERKKRLRVESVQRLHHTKISVCVSEWEKAWESVKRERESEKNNIFYIWRVYALHVGKKKQTHIGHDWFFFFFFRSTSFGVLHLLQLACT